MCSNRGLIFPVEDLKEGKLSEQAPSMPLVLGITMYAEPNQLARREVDDSVGIVSSAIFHHVGLSHQVVIPCIGTAGKMIYRVYHDYPHHEMAFSPLAIILTYVFIEGQWLGPKRVVRLISGYSLKVLFQYSFGP